MNLLDQRPHRFSPPLADSNMTPFLDSDNLDSSKGQPSSRKYHLGGLIPDIAQYGDNPVTIRLTDEELLSGITRPETIQQLLTYFHRDGFVVLENAIPLELVDNLYNQMLYDTETYISKPFLQFNQGRATKNISQVPPLDKKFFSKEFYANAHVMRVLENILGPQPELRFINSNIAIPGATGRQAVHSDVNHRFPSIPFGIVLNTYLQDSDSSNGVTEVWCGTHNAYTQDFQQVHEETGWIKKEAIQHRARVKRPVQPVIKKGSICFRDLRLWHAGMPNVGEKHRIMLAIDYFAQWYQCPMAVQLPKSLREEVESWQINMAGIDWIEGEVDHLNQAFFLNMTQDPEMYIRQTENGVEDWRARASGKFEFDRGVVSDQNYWTAE